MSTRILPLVAILLSVAPACRTPVAFNTSARQFESSDPTHPVMDAVGEGNDQAEAESNLKKAAVYAAARDLAQTDDERRKFQEWSESGYFGEKKHEAEKLVAPGLDVKSRTVNARGNVELRAMVTVDRDAVERLLVEAGVLAPQRKLVEAVDLPQLVLVPSKNVAGAAWRETAENTLTSYLKQKKIPVNASKGSADVDIAGVLRTLRDGAGGGAESDETILDVLTADVLVQYSVLLDGEEGSAKATGTVKLYETTTGEELATGTASSRLYTGTGALLEAVQEALRDAMDQATPALLSSWKDYGSDGKPYLVLVRKAEGKNAKQASMAVEDALEKVCSKVQTASNTPRATELRLRSKADARKIAREIEKALLAVPGGDKLPEPMQKGKLVVVDLGSLQ